MGFAPYENKMRTGGMIQLLQPQWTDMEHLWRPMSVGHSPHTQMKLRILRYKRACI